MSDRYEFIDAEYDGTAADSGPAPTITCMCKWLGASKSGFSVAVTAGKRYCGKEKETRADHQEDLR